MKFRVAFFIVGMVVDTIGNGLTISSNTGSAMWTAASVNVGGLLNTSIPLLIFIFGFIYAIINQFLLNRFNALRFFSELLFMGLFSYFIALFSNLFLLLHINDLNFILRSVISIIGITLIGIAISLYQRANLILHPN